MIALHARGEGNWSFAISSLLSSSARVSSNSCVFSLSRPPAMKATAARTCLISERLNRSMISRSVCLRLSLNSGNWSLSVGFAIGVPFQCWDLER